MKSFLAAVLKAAVTALLFYLIFRNVDIHQFWQTMRNASVGVLAVAFLILWGAHYICVLRWRLLMGPLMPVLPMSRLFGIYCIGLFFNLAFPTLVGGDVVKAYYAGKPTKRYAQSFAAAFLDRDSGMLALMLIASLAAILYPVDVPGVPIPLIIWSVFVAFILANLAIFAPFLHRHVTGILQCMNMTRVAGKVDAVSSAFQVMRREPRVLLGSLAISLLNQIIYISINWLMARGLHLEVPIVQFFIFIPIITLVSMIPVSLNGMGLREYAFLSLFSSIGIARESCIALGLLSSAVIIVSAIPGGVIYLFFRTRSDTREMAATLEANLS
jgi:hypothetical protein